MKKSSIKYIVGGSVVAAGLICIGIAGAIGGTEIFTHGFLISAGKVIDYEEKTITEDIDMKNITKLDIEIDAAKLIIETGDVDKVTVSTFGIVDENFSVDTSGDALRVNYKTYNHWFNFGFGGDVTIKIVIPENAAFEALRVNHGAGAAYISGIKAKNITIDSGAGETNLSGITAEYMDCKCGVGSFTVENATVGGLDIKSGVGSFCFTGTVNGDCTVKSGIGEVNINLDDNGKTYGVSTDTGIGAVSVTGDATYGIGDYSIDIHSGIGAVNVHVA